MTTAFGGTLADDIAEPVQVPIGHHRWLPGMLALPPLPVGVVLFAHGSGSSRLSPSNRFVADRLYAANVGWLLFDLLTEAEAESRAAVFDIPLLAERLRQATAWVASNPATRHLTPGYFGASTGAAAALVAAAGDPRIGAVVSRGGRPDLAGAALRAGSGAHAADRRGRRPGRRQPERPGAAGARRVEGDGGGAAGHTPVRGAGHARGGGDARRQVVRPLPAAGGGAAVRGRPVHRVRRNADELR